MDDNLTDAKLNMQKAIEALHGDVATIRTGRASPTLVENIIVSVYGGTQHLKVMELGTVSVSDPHTLSITPWDVSQVEEIRKGIATANIGINPISDGDVVRISIPPLNEERRQELVKALNQKLEGGKVMVRQIRHDVMTELKKNFEEKLITEDDRKRSEDELQKMTDLFISEIESMGSKKEQDLMSV